MPTHHGHSMSMNLMIFYSNGHVNSSHEFFIRSFSATLPLLHHFHRFSPFLCLEGHHLDRYLLFEIQILKFKWCHPAALHRSSPSSYWDLKHGLPPSPYLYMFHESMEELEPILSTSILDNPPSSPAIPSWAPST